MGKVKRKSIPFKQAKQMMKDAVDNEAKSLIQEFQEIFGEEWEAATLKMIDIDELIGDNQALKDIMILNRIDLYEILLDNDSDSIVSYFKEKINAEDKV